MSTPVFGGIELFVFKFCLIWHSTHYCQLFPGYKNLLLSISQVLFQQAAFDTGIEPCLDKEMSEFLRNMNNTLNWLIFNSLVHNLLDLTYKALHLNITRWMQKFIRISKEFSLL